VSVEELAKNSLLELPATRGCLGTDAFARPVQARSADVHEPNLRTGKGTSSLVPINPQKRRGFRVCMKTKLDR